MLWKRLRVLGAVAHYHPKCQSGTSAPHLDSVCVPVGKICIICIVFQSLKVIAKGFYMGEQLSSNWNRQSLYLLHVKYLQLVAFFASIILVLIQKIFNLWTPSPSSHFLSFCCFESDILKLINNSCSQKPINDLHFGQVDESWYPNETPDETPPGFHLRWNMFFIWDQTFAF